MLPGHRWSYVRCIGQGSGSYSPGLKRAKGGLLAKVADGDILRIDAVSGELKFMGDLAELEARDPAPQPDVGQEGCGREFFAVNRDNISNAEQGASYLFGGD